MSTGVHRSASSTSTASPRRPSRRRPVDHRRPRRRRADRDRARARQSGYPGRPGLLGHRGDGSTWAPRFTLEHVDERAGARRDHEPSTRSPGCASSRASSSTSATPGACERDAHQRRRRRRTSSTPSTSPSPCPHHATELCDVHRPLVRASSTRRRAAVRSGRVRRREPARAHVARDTRRCCSPARRASASGRGEVWGAHLAWSGNHHVLAERLPDGRRRASSSASCCTPARWCSRPASRIARPQVYAVHSPAGLTAASRGSSTPLRARPHAADSASAGAAQHMGSRLLRPRLRATLVGARRPRRRASASSASCSTTGGSGRRRDDRSGLGDWVVSPDAHPNGLPPLIEQVQVAGHGVRDLGRAGDGQPRQRPLPRPSRVGARRPPATSRCSLATSSCSTSPTPTPTHDVLGRARRAARRPRHRLRQVGHEPRPRAGQRDVTAAAGTHAQTLALYRAARRAARTASRRRDRELRRRAGRGSTSRSCAAPSGCGRATATTRSNARRSSAAPRCWCHRR